MNTRFLTVLVFAIGAVASPQGALATGGLWCEAEDDNLSFSFHAGMGRLNLGGWFNVGGSLQIRGDLVPASIENFEIAPEDVTARWLDENDARLEIQKSTPDDGTSTLFANVRLNFIAKASDGENYEGAYLLDLFLEDGSFLKKHGIVTCSAD